MRCVLKKTMICDSQSSEVHHEHDQSNYYENEDVSSNANTTSIKSFSFNETKDVFDDALSKHDRCSEDAIFSLSSIATSLKNVANSDGNDDGMFGNNETSLGDDGVFM